MSDPRLLAQAALDAIQVPFFWIAAPDGRFVYANPAGLQLLGCTREELLTRSVPDVDPSWPAEHLQSEDGSRRLKRERFSRFETQVRRRNGTLLPVELLVSYANIEGEELFFVVPIDIAALVCAEGGLNLEHQLPHRPGALILVRIAAIRLAGIVLEFG